MNIPKLQIGIITASIPIIQGGMRVRILLSSLASSGKTPIPASLKWWMRRSGWLD